MLTIEGKKLAGQVLGLEWQAADSSDFHEFDAVAAQEDEGGYSVFAVHYPGVVSQGETLDEARENIGDAFLAMLEAARARGSSLEYSLTPWVDFGANPVRLRVKVHG